MWLHVGARKQGRSQSLGAALCLRGATPGCSHLIEVGLVSSFREEKSLEKGSWLNSHMYVGEKYLVNSKLSTRHEFDEAT